MTYLTPEWPAPDNVVALTTLRSARYQHLDILPAPPAWLNQVHGTEVVNLDGSFLDVPDADASFTTQGKTVCAVLTADCLPVLLCNKSGTTVAAIHAGWRGLARGVIDETCNKLQTHADEFMAWIGPGIGPDAFEVGPDVLDFFGEQGWSKNLINEGFKSKSNTPNKWYGDLVTLARASLEHNGIQASNIYGGRWCTYSDPDHFFSYRRSADRGRMASLIWLK